VDTLTAPGQRCQSRQIQSEVIMGFLNRLNWIFFSPARLFEQIKEGSAPWWQAWLWVSIISVAAGYASIPINIALLELNPQDLSAEQLDQQLAILEGVGKWIQIGAAPIIVLLMTLAASGLTYILVSILSEKANFKKFFTLSMYTSIVSSMAYVITMLVIRLKGIDAIRTADDAVFSIGLRFLAPEEGALARAFLHSIEFFAIWAFVLVVLGLQHVFDMTRRQAIYCIIPLWLIYFGMTLLGEVFSNFS